MLKSLLRTVFLIGIVMLLSRESLLKADSHQTIRLPFAPIYTYNPASATFASWKYPITDACENGASGHVEHQGLAKYAVDIGMPMGTPIYAPVSGEIIYAQYDTTGYGLLMKIRESGPDSENHRRIHWLAHLAKFYVTSGSVNQGDLIALSGSTGPSSQHLHYHVQTPNETTTITDDATDIRGELPNISWFSDDANNDGIDDNQKPYCHLTKSVDGEATPSRIPNGVTNNNNCADFYNAGAVSGVYGFDAPNCQGHIIFGPLTTQQSYNLADMGVNDRLRSISTPGNLHFWLYAHVDNDELKHCHQIDMWNLDTDFYNDANARIGWDATFQKTKIENASESVSPGWNMVSKVTVTSSSCPSNQNTRVSAADISYGFGVGGSLGSALQPMWLEEFSKEQTSVLTYNIHTVVDTNYTANDPFSAQRVLVDNSTLFDTNNSEYFHVWDTSEWSDGYHTLKVQYRRASDGGSWTNALTYEEQIYLSPNRAGTSPCDGRDGIQLNSNDDCIILTQSFPALDHIGWSDREGLSVTVRGTYEAWIYDGGNYQGTPRVVGDGETQSAGSNVSSIQMRDPSPNSGENPTTEFSVDSHTSYLFHFNEGSGTSVTDSVTSVTGLMSSGNSWITGIFGNAISFPNPSDGRGVTTASINLCPMTVELWVKGGNGGRLIGQLGGGGNSGSNKWLLSLDGTKPKFEVWSAGGSQSITSYLDLVSNEWNYLMATYDCGTTGELYLNSQFVGELTTASTWNSGETTLEIGSTEGIYRCNCLIDEVRISNNVRVPTAPSPTPTSTSTLTPTATYTATATLTLTPTTVYSNTNLVTNGGFENLDGSGWASNWTKDQSTVSIDENAQGNDQTHSLHFTNNAVDAHAFSDQFAVLPTDTYVWSTYVKTGSGSGEFGFYIDEYDSGHNWISGQWMGDVVAGSYQTWAMFYYTPSSSSVAYIGLQLFTVGGTSFEVFADSVQFQSVSAPTATPPPSNTPVPTATFTPSATPPITNLVANGGFETLTSGWANNWTKDQSSITIDTSTQGNEGTNTLHFATNSVTAHALSQAFSVNPAYAYTWNFYLKATVGTGEFGFYIDEYDSSQGWISGQWISAVTGETNGTGNFAYVPSSSAVAYASLQYYMAANTTFDAYVDSVLVYQSGLAPTPTPTLTPTVTSTPTETFTPTPTLTPTNTAVPPTNLVNNPGFETLTSGWATNWTASAGTVTVDTSSNGNEGTNSLHLAPDTVDTHAESDNFAINPAVSYNWTFYAKTTTGSGEFGFYIDEYDSNGTWISGQWKDAVTGQSDGGHQYSYTPSSSSVAYASLQFYMVANTTFDAYVDSVSVLQN